MAPFATVEDFGAYLGETLTGARLVQATIALEMATATIQAWTRRRLERVENDFITLPGTVERELVLPDGPVESVSAVTVNGVAVGTTGYRRSGQRLFRQVGWGDPGQLVAVTYTHGYDPIPDDVRAVCIQLAAQTLSNPSGIRQEGIGSYNVTYAGSEPGGVSPGLLAALSRYRQRTASPSLSSEFVPVPPVNTP